MVIKLVRGNTQSMQTLILLLVTIGLEMITNRVLKAYPLNVGPRPGTLDS